MARVSKYSLEDKRTNELIGQLWNAFTLLENRNDVRKFLSRFFTLTEIEMFAKRLELLKLADSELEVSDLRRFTGVAKVTVYDWLEKHDAFENDFHIITDRLKELDKKRLKNLKEKVEKHTTIPKRTTLGAELIKVGAAVAYKGYKKRQKRRSVLINTQ